MTWWKFWQTNGGGGGHPDYYEEGVALLRQELYHDALTSFRLALKARPGDAATLEQMAVAYTHIGLFQEAVRSYRTALQVRPNSPAAHYGLAFLLLRAGHQRDAMRHLQAFLQNAKPDREEPRHVEHARRTLARLGGSSGEATAS